MADVQCYNVRYLGPFVAKHVVVLEGFVIPNLTAIPSTDGKTIMLCLDNRFLVEGPLEEVSKYVPIIANAMAIGAGYPWYGATSKEMPFAPMAREIVTDGRAGHQRRAAVDLEFSADLIEALKLDGFDPGMGVPVAAALRQQEFCTCENPEPARGPAMIANDCPVHNVNPDKYGDG